MRRNASLLTTATRAVTDQSILDYDAGVFDHLAADWKGHKQARVWDIPYTSAANVTVDAVTVNVYTNYKQIAHDLQFSGLVGSFTAPTVDFATNTNWKWWPFGLKKFGAEISGALNVSTPGTYTFSTVSDDGSFLFIDDMSTPVVYNGGAHGPQGRSGQKTFSSAGVYNFLIKFFEDFGPPAGVNLKLPAGVTYSAVAVTARTVSTSRLRMLMDYNNGGFPGTKVIDVPCTATADSYEGVTIPIIVTQPVGANLAAGQTAVFSVVAISSTTLSYQWYFNGAPLSGANSSVLIIGNVQHANAGSYAVNVINHSGTVTSNPVNLVIL